MMILTQGYGSDQEILVQGFGSGGGTVTYTGADVLEAVQTWWLSNGSGYTSDGYLWHLEAPETTDLPYATYFLVSEDVEQESTAFQSYRALVQINVHTETSGEAWQLVKSIRDALKGAPLVVDDNAVWHVLPDSLIAPQTGEGLGPDGADCWVAGVVFDIPWNT